MRNSFQPSRHEPYTADLIADGKEEGMDITLLKVRNLYRIRIRDLEIWVNKQELDQLRSLRTTEELKEMDDERYGKII